MVVNSETIEVLVRDRSQPQTVLKSTALTRFVDYTIEPTARPCCSRPRSVRSTWT
jgi:hypothetical protein